MNQSGSPQGDLFVARKGRLAHARERARGRRRNVERPGNNAFEREQRREGWEKLIRKTIAKRSLETVLQPIVSLRDGRPAGLEALTRFNEQPVHSPDVWFAEAASVGLGVELEVTALMSALVQLRQLPSNVYLSLNASVEALTSEEFRTRLAEAPGERIVLELTEHTGIPDYPVFERTIRGLRANGVRLAVDDAGAGYSSFRHVLKLKPDVIKLDISLTRGIDRDPARRALGSALLTFGLDAYKASVIAEGVETEGEYRTLSELGFPLGQGYYLGRPARLTPSRQLALTRSVSTRQVDSPSGPFPSAWAAAETPQGPNGVGTSQDCVPVHEEASSHRYDSRSELLALVTEVQSICEEAQTP